MPKIRRLVPINNADKSMKARGHSYPLAGPSTEQSIMMHYLNLAIIKPDSGLNGKFEQLLVMAIIIITTMVTLPGSTLLLPGHYLQFKCVEM